MLFGSLETGFNALQGSAAEGGYSVGQLLGYGGGTLMELAARVFETIYAGSGQPIPELALG